MTNNDITPRPIDILVAFALLSRLPIPRLPTSAFAAQRRAVWAFPLVGAVVSGLALLVALGGLAIGLPAGVAAGLCLAVQVVTTGAMHEDGLADTADGLWGGWTRERRLEIMKDSAIGTYGVCALILSFGLRWAALSGLLTLAPGAVIAAGALSRAGLPALMWGLPHARPDGLSHQVGRPGLTGVFLAALIGGVLALASVGLSALGAGMVTVLALALLAVIARRKIGGQTGDILGAGQQASELASLGAILALVVV